MSEQKPGEVTRLVRALLQAGGRTHQQIADEVRKQLPTAATTRASVASMAVSYRRQGRRCHPLASAITAALTQTVAPPIPLPAPDPRLAELRPLIVEVKRLARDYYTLAGRPLGVTGEVGEYEAAQRLGLALAPAREPGYDAIDGAGRRYQVKTRSWDDQAARKSQRMGSIKFDHEWEAVLLVLLNREMELLSIWLADRAAVEGALTAPGSKARTERGALSVSKFKSIGGRIWPPSTLANHLDFQSSLLGFEGSDAPEEAAAFDAL